MDGYTRLTLLLARVLISDPDCWTSGVLARDRTGRPVSPLDDAATSWCAQGALYRVVGGDIQTFRRAIRALEQSSQALYKASIRRVNDGPMHFAHASVLGAFDHAVDVLGLARRTYDLATHPPDNGVDVLQVLGLTSRSGRQALCVDLIDVDSSEGDPHPFVEEEHVATISART